MLWNLLLVFTFLIIIVTSSFNLGGLIYICMFISLYLLVKDFLKSKAFKS